MDFKTRYVALVMLGAVACNFQPGNSTEKSVQGRIEGTVVTPVVVAAMPINDESRTAPVPGAVCTLEGTGRSATADVDGKFSIDKVETGSYLLICTAELEAGETLLVVQVVDVAVGEVKTLGPLVATKPGSIRGKVELPATQNHSGVTIGIAGTTYETTSDSAGVYALGEVPVGTYDVTFRADGYRPVVFSNITVGVNDVTMLGLVRLSASTGATGLAVLRDVRLITEQNVKVMGTSAVTVDVSASADAVLMQFSNGPAFIGQPWEPVRPAPGTSVTWTFLNDGEWSLYFKFADANGLESAPIRVDFLVDTTPPSFVASINTIGFVDPALSVSELFRPFSNRFNNRNLEVAGWTSNLLLEDAFDDPSGGVEIAFSLDGTFGAPVWQPLSEKVSFVLPNLDGDYDVSYLFRDAIGNTMEQKDAYVLPIVLDRVPPTLTSVACIYAYRLGAAQRYVLSCTVTGDEPSSDDASRFPATLEWGETSSYGSEAELYVRSRLTESSPYTYAYEGWSSAEGTPFMPIGSYEARIRVADAAGNYVFSDSFSFSVEPMCTLSRHCAPYDGLTTCVSGYCE